MPTQLAVTISVLVITAVLTVQSVRYALVASENAVKASIFVLIFLCLCRSITIVILRLSTGEQVNCTAVAIDGFLLYLAFCIALDNVLYIRAKIFTQSSWFLAVFILLWSALALIKANTMRTIVAVNDPSQICEISAVNYWGILCLALRASVELILMFPFARQAYQSYMSIKTPERAIWLHMYIVNILVTFGIILLNTTTTLLPRLIQMDEWLDLMYALTNFLEANLVLFMMDDTTSVLSNKTTWIKESDNFDITIPTAAYSFSGGRLC